MEYVVHYWALKAEDSLHQLVKLSKAAQTDHLFLFSTATETHEQKIKSSCASSGLTFILTYC